MKDIYHDLLPEVSLPAAAYTKAGGAVTGNVIDLAGFDGAVIEAFSGALGAQINSYELELQESDAAGSGFAAVADADLVGTEPTFVHTDAPDVDDSSKVKTFGYIGAKRYLRVDLKVPTGAGTGSGVIGANIIKGRPRHAPVV